MRWVWLDPFFPLHYAQNIEIAFGPMWLHADKKQLPDSFLEAEPDLENHVANARFCSRNPQKTPDRSPSAPSLNTTVSPESTLIPSKNSA